MSCGFAAGKNHAVKTCEIRRLAHEAMRDVHTLKHPAVSFVISLDGNHAYFHERFLASTQRQVAKAIPRLPAAGLKQVLLLHLADIETLHRLTQLFGSFEDNLRVLEMGSGFDDCAGALRGIVGFENARADKHRFRAQLHHERSVRGSSNATRRKI